MSKEYQEKIKPISEDGIGSYIASIKRYSKKFLVSKGYNNKGSSENLLGRVIFFKEKLCRRIRVTPCKNCGQKKLIPEFGITGGCQALSINCENCKKGVLYFF